MQLFKPAPFFTLILIALSAVSFAQDKEPKLDQRYENWFQIELIIFERLSGSGAVTGELWPKNISLQYPINIQHLFTEEEWAELTTPPIELDENTSTSETPGSESETSTAPTSLSSAVFVNPEPLGTSESDVSTLDTPEDTDIPPEPVLPEMEVERILLADDDRKLNNIASAINRRNTFRVLFHEAWRQKLQQSEPHAVLIRAGDRYGEHQELEGYIELSVNRYLHFESNLWRTRFELNYGQQQEYWPELPDLPPLPVIEYRPPETQLGTENPEQLSQNEIDTNTAMEPMPLISNTDIPIDPLSAGSASSFELGASSSTSWQAENKETELAAIEKSPYLIKNISTLRQRRRMRSEELHYVDHPELGIIVKLIPYEVELPEELPEEQDANDLAQEASTP